MSLLQKFAVKYGPEAMQMLKANKGKIAGSLAGAAGLGAAGYGAAPMIDDFMTDQALDSLARNAKRGIVDAIDFAEEHPYMTSAALGGAGLLGAKLGDEGFAGLLDTVSPLQFGGVVSRKRANRGK